MEYIDENSPDGELFYRKVSTDKKIEIGVHPVIYGFRIRVGYTDDCMYMLDYCAGDNLIQIEDLYSIVLSILSKPDFKWDDFPVQKVKPMYNDPECYGKLLASVNGIERIPVSLKYLHSMKLDYIKHIWK